MDLTPFETIGTRFLHAPDALEMKLKGIRALAFDWDGVFNEGWKDLNGGSPFSEVGSMGVNLLRFALWQRSKTMLPCAVITGQHNPHAEQYVQREKFDGIYMGFTNKPDAFQSFLDKHKLEAHQVAFFFDDVLDIPLAKRCGLRTLIGHGASRLMQQYVKATGDADIITAHSGGQHGLREACEVLITLSGNVASTLEERVAYSPLYRHYLEQRADIRTEVVRNPR
jgi:3-deoxy-D-manno-octulosonate 8-phosphate phosphatase (KDO 8-P phosphatase)